MTEHPDEHGMEPTADDQRSGEIQPELRDDEVLHGLEHGVPSVEHEHGAQGSEDLSWQVEHDPAHEPAGHEADAADARAASAVSRGPAEMALAAPGGSVFTLSAEPEPAWLYAEDHTAALAAGVEHHYAAAWAADDGTGATGVLLAHGGEPTTERWEPDEPLERTIPAHVDRVVYGADGGTRETATRLWEEFAPGVPPPSGEAGEPLPAETILRTLSARLDDPIERSVINAALAHCRSEAGGR